MSKLPVGYSRRRSTKGKAVIANITHSKAYHAPATLKKGLPYTPPTKKKKK